MLTAQENEMVTKVGPGTPMGELYRRFWLPVLLSTELPTADCTPVRLTILGEDLIAFRDTSGRVGILDRRCPHRHADLFWGRNEQNGIRCVYHGWKFDVDGNCVDMPNCLEGDSFKEKVGAFASYPTVERAGLIWAYMGPKDLSPEFPDLEWTRVPASHLYVHKVFVDGNYLQTMEGDIDSSHAPFLHSNLDSGQTGVGVSTRGSVPWFFRDLKPAWNIKETDYGLMVGARREAGPNDYYWRVSQWFMPCYTYIPHQLNRAQQCNVRIPVDDERTLYFRLWWDVDKPMEESEIGDAKYMGIDAPALIPGTFYPVENKQNDYLIDRAAQRLFSFTGIKSAPAQDFAVQEDQGGRLMDRTIEHLVSSDEAIIRARRRLLRRAMDLQEGVEPPEAHNGAVYRARALDTVLPRTVEVDSAEGGAGHMTSPVELPYGY